MSDPVVVWLDSLADALRKDDRIHVESARAGVLHEVGKIAQVAQDAIVLLEAKGFRREAADLKKRLGSSSAPPARS